MAACSVQALNPPAAQTAATEMQPGTATIEPAGSTPLPLETQPQAAVAQPGAAAECSSPAALTPAVTEGPFFKANSPERSSLIEAGMSGTQLTLTGYVLTAGCKPVAHALLDFWQADAQGQYDNTGYTLRGHQFSDANGRYQLVTIVPGLYPGRTEHIHVKVRAPDGPILTTQLFFPGVADNSADGIFNPALLIATQGSSQDLQGSFNFIISPQ
jgi:protocatechuate 3,4-dioxygenase beta subunit